MRGGRGSISGRFRQNTCRKPNSLVAHEDHFFGNSYIEKKHISFIFRKLAKFLNFEKLGRVIVNFMNSCPESLVDPSPTSLECFYKMCS